MTGELTHITKKTTQVKDYKNKAYYAPEILRGNGFSVKGDTFAFGVVCLLSTFKRAPNYNIPRPTS